MNDVQLANELRGTLAERLLVNISDQGGHADRNQLEKWADGDEWATSGAVEVLDTCRLAQTRSIAGDVKVTHQGEQVAQRIRLLRAGQWRFDDLQRAVLTWIDRWDGVPALRDFLDAPEAGALEPPVRMQEIIDAVELLAHDGYVNGYGGRAIRVEIVAKGRAALRSGLPISQQGGSTQASYDYSSTVHIGDQAQIGGFQSGGHHNVQHIEQTINPALRSELAEHVASLIKEAEELSDDMPGVVEVREDLDEIGKEIAKPDAKPGIVKGLVYKALGAFAVAAATDGGQHLLKGLGHLVKLLEQAT